MTRIGIVAAVIIIVVAAIFFGFRKAARDHVANDKAAAVAKTTSAQSVTSSPEVSADAHAPGAKAGVRKIDPAMRQQLLAQISAARSRRGESSTAPAGSPDAPKELTKDYIRDQVRALIPLLTECYTNALADDPKLAGKMVVSFTIGGEPEVGGLVEESEIDPVNSTITNAGMIECVRETMYGAEFIAPSEGGRVVVHYPFEFSN